MNTTNVKMHVEVNHQLRYQLRKLVRQKKSKELEEFKKMLQRTQEKARTQSA